MNISNYIPIYQRLTEFYRSQILSQKITPGSRIDSISKIMDRHSVSRDTAKRVLKALVDQNLAVSLAGKGTFTNFTSKTQLKWGMVVPFYSANIELLISNLDDFAKIHNRKLEYFLHYNNSDEEIRLAGGLIQQGYEAIIVVPNYDESFTANFYKNLMPGKTKIVLADNTMAGSYFNYVIQSYDLGVKRAVDYLLSKNNGSLLLIGNERWQGTNLVFELMQQTFDILLQSKSPGKPFFIAHGINKLNAEYFKKNNITGILSMQDSTTVRLIGRLKKWGISIPENISIVSYGNTEITEFFSPEITAIDCKYNEMANKITNMILVKQGLNNEQIVIQPELIIRET